jgi:DNA modification methylase
MTYDAADNSRKSYEVALDAMREQFGSAVKREVRIGDAVLYQGDCLEIMPLIGKVDAVVTDPPYGISRDKGFGSGGYGKGLKKRRHVKKYVGGWDASRPCCAVFNFITEISISQIIWGGQFFAGSLPENGKWLIWDKLQTMPSYGDAELAWTSLSGAAVKKFTLGINGVIARGETGLHPTQKPVALMEWCLGFLPDAKTILDPFAGSDTTGVACAKLGRKFIGIELDSDYFNIACKRIEDAYKQADLFIEPPKAAPATQVGFDLTPSTE